MKKNKTAKYISVKRSSALEVVKKEELPYRINRPDSVGGMEITSPILKRIRLLNDDSQAEDSDFNLEKDVKKLKIRRT